MEMLKVENKWAATAASIWIQCSSGASYAFGIYSPILKSSQSYDQSTLDTVSVFKDIGANAGILSGLLYAAVTVTRHPPSFWSRFGGGPWVVLAVGAIQCFLGYFLMWASVAGLIPHPPVPAMCLFMFLAAHSQTFFNTANVVSGVQNFGDYSGTIVGIMKGFLGLSGAILIQVYAVVCKGDPTTFLLVLALLPTLTSLTLMCLVKIYETNTADDKVYLNYFCANSLIVAAYLMVIILVQNIFSLSSSAHIVTFILLLLLLGAPLAIVFKAQAKGSQRISLLSSAERNPLVNNNNPESTSSMFSARVDSTKSKEILSREDVVEAASDDKMVQDMNIFQAMRTWNFWCLCIAMLCGMGSGLATVNNLSQMGQSLGYTTVEINSLVSLYSIWNFLGRFGGGFVSDFFLHTRGWPRPILMVITLATMAAGHIIIASGVTGNLYIGSIIVGVCYGSQWSLMPTITSEIFGVVHMGTIFNTIAIASPVGSYIFSVRVIGYLYDREASKVDNSCSGKHCFMLSFLIMAAMALFGSIVAFALYVRTRRFYKVVVLRRLVNSS